MNAALPKWAWALIVALALLAAVCGRNPHPHIWWEAIPAYGAIFGYAGTYALVFLAKSILAPWLRRQSGSDSALESEV